jgi:hypothetical protein
MKADARLVAALTLLAIFVAGILAGVALDRTVQPRKVIRTFLGADMSGVLGKLELTPVQRQQADAILGRRAPAAESIMVDVAARLHSMSDSLDAELRAILTPAQRGRLDSLRHRPAFVLRRKTPGGKTVVDTVYPKRR